MENKLSLSLISNIFKPVSPSAAGGLEVFNYYLAKELEKRDDIDLKLYASGDSEKMQSLEPLVDLSLEFSKTQEYLKIPWNYRRMTVEEFAIYADFIQRQAGESLLHFSMVNFLPIYLAAKRRLPMLVTLHMPVDNLHYQTLLKLLTKEEINLCHFIAISKAQVSGFPIYKIIRNGVDTEDFKFKENFRANFIWIGRFIKEKGCLDAISAVKKAGVGLEIAGKPHDPNENIYFEEVKKEFNQSVNYKGFVSGFTRNEFYAGRALLFTPRWEEPFGLTMIEAMASGTPVIAYNRGAAKEVIEDGVNGFITSENNADALAAAISKMEKLPNAEYLKMRRQCRETVEKKFSFRQITDAYIDTYKEIKGER